MEQLNLNRLFLKTAFSCMACDGDIDMSEVSLIKKLHHDNKLFGDIDINHELEKLLLDINREGNKFLRDFFKELTTAQLSEQDEIKLIEVAIKTIRADNKIDYSEIKFFKVIRSKLKIKNDVILEIHPEYEEFFEQDIISETYLTKLMDDYFNFKKLPQFELICINDDVLKNIDKN